MANLTSSQTGDTGPFLKWAGSKSRYASKIVALVPKNFGIYMEPFLGSGSLFFKLRPAKAVLSDLNRDLINTYIAVRDSGQEVENLVRSMPVDKESYYRVREGRSLDPIRWAAEFIYLNRLCWNGLYRVNSSGKFNVPFGALKGSSKLDTSAILKCSSLLSQSNVNLCSSDFEVICDAAKKDDFVFIDPPYVTSHNNNGFIEYNEKIFSWGDQIRLAEACRRMHAREVKFLVTNANHHDVASLYEGFNQQKLSRISTLAANKNFRKLTSELIIRNFGE